MLASLATSVRAAWLSTGTPNRNVARSARSSFRNLHSVVPFSALTCRACVGNQWEGYPPVGRIFIRANSRFRFKQNRNTKILPGENFSQIRKYFPKILPGVKIPPATANAELLWATDESVISDPKLSNFDGKDDFLICWWRSPCSISVATCPIWMCSGIFDTYSSQFVQKLSLCSHQNSAKYLKYSGAPTWFRDFQFG